MAINWAVNCFVIALLFVIALAYLDVPSITASRELALVGTFIVAVHGAVIWFYARSTKWRTARTIGDTDGIKMLEYTVSVVCWVIQFALWYYKALEAAVVFLFIPTYFVTSLLVLHISFRRLAGLEMDQKSRFFLVFNFCTLGHYIIVIIKARLAAGAG